MRFNQLKRACKKGLQEKNTPVVDVVDALTNLPADDVDEHKQFLESRLSVLYQANDHNELIGHLSFSMNYLSYHLLDYVASEFDLKEVIVQMEDYKAELQQFRKRTPLTLFCKSQKRHVEPLPTFKKLVAKIRWPNNEDITLEHVEQFRQRYAYHYNLRDCAMMLVQVRGNSFIVTWFIPESIVDKLMKQQIPIHILMEYFVYKLEIAGVCVYRYHKNLLHSKVQEWVVMRKKTLKMMRDTADDVDKHYKDVNISRIVVASTAMAGVAVGAGIATLITSGAAALIPARGIISITGGGTSAGTSNVNMIISKFKLSDVQKQIDTDNEMLEKLKKLKSNMKEMEKVLQAYSSRMDPSHESKEVLESKKVLEAPKLEKKEATFMISTTSSIARTGSEAAAISITGGKGAVKVGEIALESDVLQVAKVEGGIVKGRTTADKFDLATLQAVAAVGSIALDVVVIPLNIIEIVTSGISLYKGSETKAGHELRENADKYEEQMNGIIKKWINPDNQ